MRTELIQRVQAAEGFVNTSNVERRERYGVVIAGLIQHVQNLSNLWTVFPPVVVTDLAAYGPGGSMHCARDNDIWCS